MEKFMKIGINFNYDKYSNQENISKLLLVPEVKKWEDDRFCDYYIEAVTLEEFDSVLSKIEKAFDYDADLIITTNRLQIFIQFRDE